MSTATATRIARALDGARAPRVVIYARISRDREGKNLGVDRQFRECRELVGKLDGRIVRELHDNDISGYTRAKPRPGYDELVRLIAAGEVDVLVAWHQDRLTRRLIELAELIELCQANGVTIHTKLAGALDPNNPSAVMQVQIAGSVAEYESAVKSRRIKSRHKEIAEAGGMHGGKRRFGYNLEMTEVDAGEAAIIRELAARVLGGQTLASCAKWLTESGVPTALGGTWTGSNVGLMLKRPHLAGLRIHRGEVVGSAEWPAILDMATHEQLKAKLGDPARRTNFSNARKYLLAGLATCGTCGKVLRGRPSYYKGGDGRAYACITGAHCHRPTELLDDYVTELVIERLERTDASGAFVHEHDVTLEALAKQKEALGDRYAVVAIEEATGERSAKSAAATHAALDDELARIETAIEAAVEAAAAPELVLTGATGSGAREAWAGFPLERQRSIVALLCTVELHPASGRGRNGPWQPERDVTITWR